MRKALSTSAFKTWTAEAVFTAECGEFIKQAIYRDFPKTKDVPRGFLPHYPRYKRECFKALSEEYREFFEKRAADWSRRGGTSEQKERYATSFHGRGSGSSDECRNQKSGLAKFLKETTFKAEREYGVYIAFIVIPEPGSGGEPQM